MNEVFIVDGVRTPIGKFRGALSECRADDLAALTINALLKRNAEVEPDVTEVILGAANQAGEDNRNVARMASILAGLPHEVTGVTVNRLCASGLEAVIQSYRAIATGDHQVMIAGGVESMTRAPYVMQKSSEAFPRTPPALFDTSLGWRFPNSKMAELFPLISMGETAENVASEYNISREDQDLFAVRSHQLASEAQKNGRFQNEIIAVPLPALKKGGPEREFTADEGIRSDASLETLAKLQPAFRKGGSVTAGNASTLNDGASALLLVSAGYAKSKSLKPIAKVVASASAGVHPNVMGIGPVPATQKLLQKTGLSINEIDLFEINEAFAAQSLACVRTLGIDPEKVNVNGGAIALGHPLGSSGARLVVSLVHELKRRGLKRGVATLCVGVGQGVALLVERV